MNEGALRQFRVIDLSTDIAGAYCSKFLADYGADVIKVEPVGLGDPTRGIGPFFHDDPHHEKSLLFFYLNCNKRSITLNIDQSSSREILVSLFDTADVLIESFTPSYLQDIGLEYSVLEAINPRLVVTSLAPFGQTGKYRNYAGNDLIYYAMSGMMYTSGAYDREPLKHGHPQSYYMAGQVAAYATTAALYARAFSGEGQHVDLSMQEVVAAHHYMSPTRYSYMGAIERRAPKIEGGSFKGTRFEGIVPGKDGYIGASGQHGRQRPLFTEYANLLGRPDIDDPKFATPSSRIEHAEELDSVLLPILEQWNKYDYFDAAKEQGWVAGVVQTSEDLINCPQLEARGYYTEVEHPFIGKIKIPGEIFRLPESPWTMRTSAPLLGQHNKEVYCDEMGYTKRELILMRQQGVI